MLTAIGSQTVDAIVASGSAAVSGGLVGVGLSGAGAAALNRIAARVEAAIDGDGSFTGGTYAYSVSLSATDTSVIHATTGAAALAVGIGALGVGGAVGIALAENEIANQVKAYIANLDSGVISTDAAYTTSNVSTTVTLSPGDRVKILSGYAHGGTPGAVYQFLGSGSVDLGMENFGDTARWTPVSSSGGFSLSATESASITATTAAAAFAGSVGGIAISFAGAGADARNVILTKTDAYIDSSDVRSAAGVSLMATSTGTSITAEVVSAAAALALGGLSGSFAIGASVAENYIGWDPHGTTSATYTTDSTPSSVTQNQTVKIASGAHAGDVYRYVPSTPLNGSPNLKTQDYTDASKWVQVGTTAAGETKAYVTGSSLVAATTLSASATSGETINATVASVSAALALGGVAVAAAAAGVYVVNRIGQATQAYIGPTRGVGIQVKGSGDAISLTAQDTSTITATGGAASIAASIGLSSFSAAVALALARNDIQSDVEAYTSGATIDTCALSAGSCTTSGALKAHATNMATITASSTAAAFSASFSLAGGNSLAGGGASEDISVTSTTKAYATGGSLTLGGLLELQATDTSRATATVEALAASVSLDFGGAAAGSFARVTVSPTTQAYTSGATVSATSVAATATEHAKAVATANGMALSTGVSGAGSVATATLGATVQAFITGSSSTVTARSGAIMLKALYNADDDGNTAAPDSVANSANAVAGAVAGGILVGASGATATAIDQAVVDAYVGSGSLSASGAITLLSTSYSAPKARTEDDGLGIGAGEGEAITVARAKIARAGVHGRGRHRRREPLGDGDLDGAARREVVDARRRHLRGRRLRRFDGRGRPERREPVASSVARLGHGVGHGRHHAALAAHCDREGGVGRHSGDDRIRRRRHAVARDALAADPHLHHRRQCHEHGRRHLAEVALQRDGPGSELDGDEFDGCVLQGVGRRPDLAERRDGDGHEHHRAAARDGGDIRTRAGAPDAEHDYSGRSFQLFVLSRRRLRGQSSQLRDGEQRIAHHEHEEEKGVLDADDRGERDQDRRKDERRPEDEEPVLAYALQ